MLKKLFCCTIFILCCFLPAYAAAASTPDPSSIVQIYTWDYSIKDASSSGSGVLLNNYQVLTNYHVAQDAIDNPDRYSLVVCTSGKINTWADCQYAALPSNLSDNAFSQDFDLALVDLTGRFVSSAPNQTKDIKDWTASDYPQVKGINLASYGMDISALNIKAGAEIQTLGYPAGHNNTLAYSTGTVIGQEYFPSDNSMYVNIAAPINFGSSGGGVFDSNGKFVGITAGGWANSKGKVIQGYILPVTSINYWLDNITNAVGTDKGSFPIPGYDTIMANYQALCRLGNDDYCLSDKALPVSGGYVSQEKLSVVAPQISQFIKVNTSSPAKISVKFSIFDSIFKWIKGFLIYPLTYPQIIQRLKMVKF